MAAQPTPAETISVIDSLSYAPPGYRRGHARGLGVRGTFRASPEARALTSAEHFQGGAIPCVARFSNASANPCAPDRISGKEGRVQGLAIRFELPSGAAATWAGINIPVFPARDPAEFIALTKAQAAKPGGKPNMGKLIWHLIRHLHILTSVKHIKALRPLRTYGTETFHGIHVYYLVDAKGIRKPFRYRWVPSLAGTTLSPEEAEALPKLYLLNELRSRLGNGPLAWDLIAQFGEAGDPVNDPSAAWPVGRLETRLGRLTLDRVHEDQKAVEGMVFDPTGVVPGLALSDDPILHFRAAVYGESYSRRTSETRTESAPEDMGQ